MRTSADDIPDSAQLFKTARATSSPYNTLTDSLQEKMGSKLNQDIFVRLQLIQIGITLFLETSQQPKLPKQPRAHVTYRPSQLEHQTLRE